MRTKRIITIDNPKYLPLAVYTHMFEDIVLFYKGEQLSSKMLFNKHGECAKGLRIGEYLYVVPNMYGKDNPIKKRARAGEKLLFIIENSTGTCVGTVENGVAHKRERQAKNG